jgi:predicted DNA-binding transcriptional regulator AlpA
MDGYLTSEDLATRLGVKRESIHRMRTRGDLPDPDAVAGRTPLWRPETIDTWQANRPGQGWRKGALPPVEQ